LGIKGVGEGGAIPVPSLMAQAFEDALQEFDLEVLEMPLSPNKLFDLIHRR
jgi:CO/xanthine dehydrogenase Mo-binding subunit